MIPRVAALHWLVLLLVLLAPAGAWAHPAPFSYLDLDLKEDRIDGLLTVHAIDIAHELELADPQQALDQHLLDARFGEITPLLAGRLNIGGDLPATLEWTGARPLIENDAIQLAFRIPHEPPGSFSIAPQLFPYDPQHQTFVNVYEQGELRQQMIFAAGGEPQTYYTGSAQGVWAIIKVFVPTGAHHILIGPDHLLFLFGLLLLGGSLWQLVRIVTAFTIGHSITLGLAVLDIVTVPGWLVEPAIALTIIVVGADNLLRGEGRDFRFWMALGFGLIHGFGFASVLQEFGLPQSALGWSLFSFNVGVELGQLAAVVPLAFLLAGIRRYRPRWSRRVELGGSILVIGAGAFWFVQRVFV
ncbi:MAG TPA: HupE/UreJ family protein [Sphingomonadaceae bacterium]|nr:HupE/UreJ family protein [Sphingomonadaceae bacterium]